jgi:hypothetical protein
LFVVILQTCDAVVCLTSFYEVSISAGWLEPRSVAVGWVGFCQVNEVFRPVLFIFASFEVNCYEPSTLQNLLHNLSRNIRTRLLLPRLAHLRGVPHDHLQLQRCIAHLQSKRRTGCRLVQPGRRGTALLATSTCISTLPFLSRNTGGSIKGSVHELCRSGDTHCPSTATCGSLGLQRVCVGLLSVASRYHIQER